MSRTDEKGSFMVFMSYLKEGGGILGVLGCSKLEFL